MGAHRLLAEGFALVQENPPAGMLAWCVDSVRIAVGCVEKCEVSSSRPSPAAIVDVASRWSLPFVSLSDKNCRPRRRHARYLLEAGEAGHVGRPGSGEPGVWYRTGRGEGVSFCSSTVGECRPTWLWLPGIERRGFGFGAPREALCWEPGTRETEDRPQEKLGSSKLRRRKIISTEAWEGRLLGGLALPRQRLDAGRGNFSDDQENAIIGPDVGSSCVCAWCQRPGSASVGVGFVVGRIPQQDNQRLIECRRRCESRWGAPQPRSAAFLFFFVFCVSGSRWPRQAADWKTPAEMRSEPPTGGASNDWQKILQSPFVPLRGAFCQHVDDLESAGTWHILAVSKSVSSSSWGSRRAPLS